MRQSKLLVIALAGVLFFAINAWSAFEIHPRFLLAEEYNDNIFLSEDNEAEDWITTVEPGVNLTYKNRSVDAVIDYSLRYRFYQDHDDETRDEFKDVQRADATVLFFGDRPFTLRLSETISSEELDERDSGADYNELVNRSTVYHSTVTPEYRWQLTPTFSLVFGYTYDRLDYVDSAGDDYDEHSGRFSLVKQVSATTELFARYTYIIHQSDDAADEFDRHDYTLGLTQELSGRITASIEAGLSEVEYDSGFDTDGMVWSVDVSYYLSEPVTFTLGFSQDFETTAEDGLTKTREASVGANYKKESLTASSELFWNNSEYVRLDREDEAYGIRFDLSKPFATALTFHVDAEYERAEYNDPGVNEEVDRVTLGTSLDYEYRRFLASLGYRYRINESDIDSHDYDNHIVTLSGTVRF